jgi:hypothetical protein
LKGDKEVVMAAVAQNGSTMKGDKHMYVQVHV